MIRLNFIFLFIFCTIHIIAQDKVIEEEIRKYIEIQTSNVALSGERLNCTNLLPQYYLQRSFKPVWKNPDHITQLLTSLKNAQEEGLNPEDYHYSYLKNLYKNGNVLSSELDVLLSDSYFLYATHLIRGKVDPETLDSQWKANRREVDLIPYLDEAILNNKISGSLITLLPTYKTYTRLKMALQNYRQVQYDGGWKSIELGETLKLGMKDKRIIDIKNRLIATGDLKANEKLDEEFSSTLEVAVKKFQLRHGLEVDGGIGKSTIETLNIPVEIRINQIMINMERCRWLPTELGEKYVLVNIANYKLEAVKYGKIQMEMDVVVGKSYRKTPVFSSQMVYLVFNPYWTVPPTIFDNDIVPAVMKNINYLKKLNIKVVSGYGVNETIIDPATINWSKAKSGNFPYKLRQDPGDNNALGYVKFIFPNSYNVYMHDTNHRELFVNVDRALSSGCIRLSKPLELAEYVLKDSYDDMNMERIQSIVAKEKNQTFILRQPINVHLLYWTSFVDENDLINFRKDIYDRDSNLTKALFSSNRPI